MASEASLKGVQLLDELPDDELSVLQRACGWRRYQRDEEIIDQDSDSRDVYFVVQGEVRVANYSVAGHMITLDDLPEGSYFGELSALDGQPRSAGVVALTDCLLASLAPARFLELIETHPSVAVKVMTRLAQVVRTADDRIMDLSTLGAVNRVQAELLRRARESLDAGGPPAITPVPVFSDIASRVSSTRETVSRVINELVRQEIVERTADSLVIHHLQRLEAMVHKVRGE
jgi:CRP-like cAMP-binding protein